MSYRILLVEDDPDSRALVGDILRDADLEVDLAEDLAGAVERQDLIGFDAVIADYELPDGTGLDLCRHIQEVDRELPVLLLTSHAKLAVAVEALRAGAYDFLTKPIEEPAVLLRAVSRACQDRELRHELRRIQDHEDETLDADFPGIVARSAEMREALGLLRRVAPFDANVLITGETGTGKELVARALHTRSPRAEGEFVALNCASVPSELLESELFGHKAGAFTGAEGSRRGLFLTANGGTLFLDEIGDMASDLQAKLLRVLQERKLRPVGSDEAIPFDVRVVAATHRDLRERVAKGAFREDLFFRLNVVEIRLPPLRRRGPDILTLARFLLRDAATRMARPEVTFSPEAAARLMAYAWPGNVRELQNCVERAVIVHAGEQIELRDLPEDVLGKGTVDSAPEEADEGGLETLEEVEARHIARVFAALGGNKVQVAKTLGIDRTTLYRKLKRYGLATSAAP